VLVAAASSAVESNSTVAAGGRSGIGSVAGSAVDSTAAVVAVAAEGTAVVEPLWPVAVVWSVLEEGVGLQ
jgi:hypothetical protein